MNLIVSSMDKIALWINFCADDKTSESAIIGSNADGLLAKTIQFMASKSATFVHM